MRPDRVKAPKGRQNCFSARPERLARSPGWLADDLIGHETDGAMLWALMRRPVKS